jgi:hypothetical protein
MDTLPKSRLLRSVERAKVLASRTVKGLSTRYSRERFTLRQHVVLLCLEVKRTTTYRDRVDDSSRCPVSVTPSILVQSPPPRHSGESSAA